MRIPFINLRIMPFGLKSALNNQRDLILALTWRRVLNRNARVFANSIPKAGTHLLNRCLSLLPGMASSGLHIENLNSKQSILNRLGGACFVSAHLPFSNDGWTKLQTMGYRQVLMVRDPRDVVVSQFQFITKRPSARLYSYFAKFPDDEARIMAVIQGIADHEVPDGRGLPDIGMQFNQYLQWSEHGSHVVRFENLVGEAGGGNLEQQLAEVEALAKHVRIVLSSFEIENIAKQVFYRNAKTFRKGEIGDWRNYLSANHKYELKNLAGQILIDLGYEHDFDW